VPATPPVDTSPSCREPDAEVSWRRLPIAPHGDTIVASRDQAIPREREAAMPKRKLEQDEYKRKLSDEDDTEGQKKRLSLDEPERLDEKDDVEGHKKR
jgi:hypothetical protein